MVLVDVSVELVEKTAVILAIVVVVVVRMV